MRSIEEKTTSTRVVKTYCGICAGLCGLDVTLNSDGTVTDIRGDHTNPLSAGYACIKGLQLPEAHRSPERLLRPLKRQPDGEFVEIGLERALDEIGAQLNSLLLREGAEAIAAFRGTMGYSNYMLPGWLRCIGSHGFYSTMTVDQSAKWVSYERLGSWAGGREPFDTADVMLLVGANPLVSLSTFNFNNQHPVNSMRAAKARGMKLIVIDPRVTETARYADLHLQPHPGEDCTLVAGLLHLILANQWHDAEFCTQHVNGLDELRRGVAPYTPSYVAERAGVPESHLELAATLFARRDDGGRKRGTAASGVGPNMAPHSNLAEHLVECLNAVCGRYPRAGDPVPNPGVLSARQVRRAQAISPRRSWESGYHSAIGGYGTLFGEKMSGALCDEILTGAPGQVKALIVDSANPVNAIPDQRKVIRAMRALELLVVIDPFMTNTARLADYILPPPMLLERPAIPPRDYETIILSRPYSQYAPAVLEPPPGAELADPNYVFWSLAKRMDKRMVYDGVELDMQRPPTSDDLFALLARNGQIPYSEIRQHEGGKVYPVPPQFVEPADPATAGRLELAPLDVQQELYAVSREAGRLPGPFTHRLCGRRMRDVQNSMYRHLPLIRKRHPYNPAYLSPEDMVRLDLRDGARVRIVSAHGSITAIVRGDETVRAGVISMTHGWGGMPDDEEDYDANGASTNLLTSTDVDIDPINAMPLMSAIPVYIESL